MSFDDYLDVMDKKHGVTISIPYDRALMLIAHTSVDGFEDIKKQLEDGIKKADEDFEIYPWFKHVRFARDEELHAFIYLTLAEYRENHGNYVYANGLEFDPVIEKFQLNEDDYN